MHIAIHEESMRYQCHFQPFTDCASLELHSWQILDFGGERILYFNDTLPTFQCFQSSQSLYLIKDGKAIPIGSVDGDSHPDACQHLDPGTFLYALSAKGWMIMIIFANNT